MTKQMIYLVVAVIATGLLGCSRPADNPAESATVASTTKAENAPQPAPETKPPASADGVAPVDPEIIASMVATAFGKGAFDADGKKVSFSFDAYRLKNDTGGGHFRFNAFLDGGKKMDISAQVDCLSFDPETRRVWIGGRISNNLSTHADYTTRLQDSGMPVFFRIADTTNEDGPAAYISNLMFEGQGGFIKAQSYCEQKPWDKDGVYTPSDGTLVLFP